MIGQATQQIAQVIQSQDDLLLMKKYLNNSVIQQEASLVLTSQLQNSIVGTLLILQQSLQMRQNQVQKPQIMLYFQLILIFKIIKHIKLNQQLKIKVFRKTCKFYYNAGDGVDMCFAFYQELFDSKAYQFRLPEGRNSLKLTLQGHFDEPLTNEGWGAKRFTLEILQPCVEFYSDCNFQGEAWRICSGNQTSQARKIPFEIKSILIANGIQVKMRDPKYHGGQTQTYTSSQYCLSSYQFPKYNLNA